MSAVASLPYDHPQRARSRRARAVRATSVSMNRLPKFELERERLVHLQLLAETGPLPERPATRGECANGERPCPFVSCAHHLYLDVAEETGAIKLNFPDLEVDGLPETCALDVADRGGAPLEAVGVVMNVTRERVRQIEVKSADAVRRALARRGIRSADQVEFERPVDASADPSGDGVPRTPPDEPREGDRERRMVQRLYERALLARGLALRSARASTSVHDDEDDDQEEDKLDPEKLQPITPELQAEVDEWLSRVVIVDGEDRYPANELGRDFVNAWRRAGGEAPLPPGPIKRGPVKLALVPPSSSPEATVVVRPPLPGQASAVASAIDPGRQSMAKEESGLTERQQAVVDTAHLKADEAAKKVGCTVATLYATRSTLRRKGKLAPAEETPSAPARELPRAKREGGGRKVVARSRVVELVATVAQTDDELIAPLRAELDRIDTRRARVVAGIVALGGSV